MIAAFALAVSCVSLIVSCLALMSEHERQPRSRRRQSVSGVQSSRVVIRSAKRRTPRAPEVANV